MKKQRIIVSGLAGFLLVGSMLVMSACSAMEKKQQAGAAVELNGNYIYQSTLDALTLGLSGEDSTRVAQQYIRQWAQDILLYDEATTRSNKQIEALVEDYRRTLYVQAYEDKLVDKRMSKTILDSTVLDLYQSMPDRFRLEESIMQGVLVIVPTDAPQIDKLRNTLSKVSGEGSVKALDEVEKYVYQNASGYEIFADKWMTTTEMMNHMPLDRAEFENRLKARNMVEVSDSAKLYILQVTAKHMRGEAMPIEYARPEIEKIILNARRVEFLRKERERLYNEAIQDKKITFF
jgi:hypothetical protein